MISIYVIRGFCHPSRGANPVGISQRNLHDKKSNQRRIRIAVDGVGINFLFDIEIVFVRRRTVGVTEA